MRKIAILMLLLLTATGATVRYVSKTGTSIAPYTSWKTAADSIQKCLDICQYGDTVYVGEGEYVGHFVGKDGLTIIGSGIENCIFSDIEDFFAQYTLLTLGNSCKVMNITFKGGTSSKTVNGIIIKDSSYVKFNKFENIYEGIFTEGNTNINNNIFLSQGHGAFAITCWSGEGEINIFNNFFDFDGTAIQINYGTPLIHNNIFYLDKNCVGIYTEKIAEVDNNLFVIQSMICQTFFGYYSHYNIQLNNVVIGPVEGLPGAFLINKNNLVKNNIAINGKVGFAPDYDFTTSANFGYNNSFNNTTNYGFAIDSTNLTLDPMFVNDNPDSVDVHLQAFSPMIDMGDPNIKDVDGTRSDIGLYGGPYGEEYLYADLAPKTPRNWAINLIPNKAKLSWNANTEADFSNYRIYKDTVKGFTIDSSKILMNTTATEIGIDTLEYTQKNTYFKIVAVDKKGHVSRPSEEVALLLLGVKGSKINEENFLLYPAYPNPFNPSTRISYQMRERGYVKLQVYTLQGELLSTLVDKEQPAGYYETDFTGKNLNNSPIASGVYLYRIEIKNNNHQSVFIEMKKMIYLK